MVGERDEPEAAADGRDRRARLRARGARAGDGGPRRRRRRDRLDHRRARHRQDRGSRPRSAAATAAGIRFVEGRAVSYAQSFPYWPIRELLREWLGVAATTPEARVRLELKAQLARLLGAEADDAYPFLAGPLGLDARARRRRAHPRAEPRGAPAPHVRRRLRAARAARRRATRCASSSRTCTGPTRRRSSCSRCCSASSRSRPSRSSCSTAPSASTRSWRLGERARQRYPHRYREIELRPLAPDASRALAVDRAPGTLPESVVELLAERAGGNPFFLEEALRDLVERGALRAAERRLGARRRRRRAGRPGRRPGRAPGAARPPRARDARGRQRRRRDRPDVHPAAARAARRPRVGSCPR